METLLLCILIFEIGVLVLLYFKISFSDIKFYFKNKDKIISSIASTKPLKIYRFEKEGIGPYKRGILSSEESENKPTLYTEDRILYTYLLVFGKMKSFRFGFSSLEDLYNWFNEIDLKILEDTGFKLVEYESTEYFLTEKQVVFSVRNSKRVS